MTPDPPDFDRLFAQARAGDVAAWETLFHACYPKVLRAVRRRLTRPLRPLFDSTDFASDVFRRLVAEGGQLDFQSFPALIAYLETQAEGLVMAEQRRRIRSATGD
jgi:hypothetical protein